SEGWGSAHAPVSGVIIVAAPDDLLTAEGEARLEMRGAVLWRDALRLSTVQLDYEDALERRFIDDSAPVIGHVEAPDVLRDDSILLGVDVAVVVAFLVWSEVNQAVRTGKQPPILAEGHLTHG